MRNDLKIAAFSIQRRSIAVAIFVGTHLSFSDSKQLTTDPDKARTSAIGFANWIVESFGIESAVLETAPRKDTVRLGNYECVEQALRLQGVSIEAVPTEHYFNAFAYPGKVHREDVHQVVARIWPILGDSKKQPTKFDAVALGLYCQTDRILS